MWWIRAYRVVLVKVLPLLIKLSHVHQPVFHLLKGPYLLPFAFPPHLNGRFAQYSISLHTQTQKRSHDCTTNAYPKLISCCPMYRGFLRVLGKVNSRLLRHFKTNLKETMCQYVSLNVIMVTLYFKAQFSPSINKQLTMTSASINS